MGTPSVDQELVEFHRENILAGIQRLSESVADGHCNYEQLRDIDRLLDTANEMSGIEQYSLTHQFIYSSVLVGDATTPLGYEPYRALPFNNSLYYFTPEDRERFNAAKSHLSAAREELFSIRPIHIIDIEERTDEQET